MFLKENSICLLCSSYYASFWSNKEDWVNGCYEILFLTQSVINDVDFLAMMHKRRWRRKLTVLMIIKNIQVMKQSFSKRDVHWRRATEKKKRRERERERGWLKPENKRILWRFVAFLRKTQASSKETNSNQRHTLLVKTPSTPCFQMKKNSWFFKKYWIWKLFTFSF